MKSSDSQDTFEYDSGTSTEVSEEVSPFITHSDDILGNDNYSLSPSVLEAEAPLIESSEEASSPMDSTLISNDYHLDESVFPFGETALEEQLQPVGLLHKEGETSPYGSGRPRRITIRAKLMHDESL